VRFWELTEETQKVVAVMPGGFHPFHPGHKSLYDWAVETFGKENVYVAATNDTSTRPFPFNVKQKLAGMAGVPASKFIQIKSPFNALSYEGILGNPSKTSLVFVRSEKDQGTHPLPDQIRKSDGMPGYLISFKGKDQLQPAESHAHIAYGPTIDFNFSGMNIKSATQLREKWPTLSEQEKLEAAELMYPGNGKVAVQLLDQALGGDAVGEGLEEKDLDPITLQRILKFADDRDRYNSGTGDAVMSTKGTNELIAKARAQAKRDRIKNTKAHAHRKDGVHKQGFKQVKFDPVKWEPDSYTKVDLGGGRKDVGK